MRSTDEILAVNFVIEIGLEIFNNVYVPQVGCAKDEKNGSRWDMDEVNVGVNIYKNYHNWEGVGI